MSKHTDWTPELEADLAEPFPAEYRKTKSMGGRQVTFVPWHRYVSRLNELVGFGWSRDTPITMHVENKLVMGLPITIFGTTRVNFGDEDDSEYETVVNKQTGEEEEKKTMYGSPVTNAYAQAFKRSCAMFGMGLDMYDKDAKPVAKPAPKPAPQQDTRAFTVPAQSQGVKLTPELLEQIKKDGDFEEVPKKNPIGPPTQSAADPFLDMVAPGPKAGGKTWTQLLATDAGFVKWAVEKMTRLSDLEREVLKAALNNRTKAAVTNRAGGGEVVILEDLMNRCAEKELVTFEQCQRINQIMDEMDAAKVESATVKLKNLLAQFDLIGL